MRKGGTKPGHHEGLEGAKIRISSGEFRLAALRTRFSVSANSGTDATVAAAQAVRAKEGHCVRLPEQEGDRGRRWLQHDSPAWDIFRTAGWAAAAFPQCSFFLPDPLT
jgi:hypothetical protein